MPGSARIKFVRSLQQKKFRKLYGRFVAEGDKIVSELLQGSYIIDSLYALPSWVADKEQAGLVMPNCTAVSEKELERMSGLMSPNQVLAVLQIPESTKLPEHPDDVSLYIDGVQDPGNLGTIIRTADWFGIRHVFCSENTVELYNPKVIQATMGSFIRVMVQAVELPHLLSAWPNKPHVYGASLHGTNLFDQALKKPALIVIGNESKGISHTVQQHIDASIRIPGGMSAAGSPPGAAAESLNAAVAAAICIAWASK